MCNLYLEKSRHNVWVQYSIFFVSVGAKCRRGGFWTPGNNKNRLFVTQSLSVQRYCTLHVLYNGYDYFKCQNLYVQTTMLLSLQLKTTPTHFQHLQVRKRVLSVITVTRMPSMSCSSCEGSVIRSHWCTVLHFFYSGHT